jgi:hypothetical protein
LRWSTIGRLEHIDLPDEVRTNSRKIDGTATCRCGHVTAINQCVVEVAAEAAHSNPVGVTAGAGPLDRNARNALHGGRHVRIREFTDIFGRDRVDNTGGVPLDVDVALQRPSDASDDDRLRLVVLIGRCRGSSRRGRRSLRCRGIARSSRSARSSSIGHRQLRRALGVMLRGMRVSRSSNDKRQQARRGGQHQPARSKAVTPFTCVSTSSSR